MVQQFSNGTRYVFPYTLPTPRAGSGRSVLDQAKGALMLRYGIGSHLALVVLLRWARDALIDVDTLSRTLLHVVAGGEPEDSAEPSLAVWVDQQLRTELPIDTRL